ncbi:NYN domain-containing protein [Vibrio vulnificus]|uniref:LabA-like NYN domain-containing protein n=1 Tax=Vibrio vulnificus TaxID=672 RepID=UPI0019D4DFE7|nr:NYN domain-containing protein [Vibrio vulnificus]MBN8031275.1 NYN domain-containing protein [Vibrio vulnificus]
MRVMTSKVAIFVDVQNIYYTCKEKYRKHFDYNRFWQSATQDKQVVVAHAYAISSKDPGQRQFHHVLRGIGFDVKLKPFIQRWDGSAKGDWDVGLALDAFEYAPMVDEVILLSGDGDFEILVERIQQKFGKKVTVYGVPGLTAQNLQAVVDRYIPIEDELLLP